MNAAAERRAAIERTGATEKCLLSYAETARCEWIAALGW